MTFLHSPAMVTILRLYSLSLLFSAILAGIVVVSQCSSGTYDAEFHHDEASHYVSGLAIKQYFQNAFPESPVKYITTFHSSYPIVGIGHWPPFFYGIEAIWMALFSTSKASVLALSALFTFMTAVALLFTLTNQMGKTDSILAALAFVMIPAVRTSTNDLMLDIPVALLCFMAMLSLVRFLDTGRVKFSISYGVFTSAAVLTKGNGLCLVLLPVMTLMIARRYDVLLKPSFWVPLPIVLIVAGPWYILTYPLVEQGFTFEFGTKFIALATAENASYLLTNLGPLTLLLACIGSGSAAARRRIDSNLLNGAVGLAMSVLIFQSIVPSGIQERYLIPAFPPLLIAAVYGVRDVGRILRAPGLFSSAVFGLAILIPFLTSERLLIKPDLGYSAAANAAWQAMPPNNKVVLVATNGLGEAAFIAELAMRDGRAPSILVIRGSRLFGAGGYMDATYQNLAQTPDEIMNIIDEYSIPLLIFQPRTPAAGNWKTWKHIDVLGLTISERNRRFKLVFKEDRVSPGVFVFEIVDNLSKAGDISKIMELNRPREKR